MADDEEESKDKKIFEFVASAQRAGNDRGRRIYFDRKSLEEIREKCGDDFFLFTERTLLAFVNTNEEKIMLTSRKSVIKKLL